ncbi:MAG: diacylglycerol kinase family lipid kinase [Chloroflexi bacterium]|nr:diacylglycerol kinase family lipid kinase [Chloroflexota bacterium]
MPAKIILNPYSNRWGASKMAEPLQEVLRGLNYDFDFVQTSGPREAVDLAAEAALAGFDPIVAAGGDGAVSEVVNGLLMAGLADRVRLGVAPLGSANDYAYQLGIPTDLEAACRILVQAERERVLDAGRINDYYFMNDITIAFGAQVNVEAAKIKRLRGSLLYLGGVFKALMNYHQPTIDCRWDDGRLEEKQILLAYVGNGFRTGGVFFLAPQARLDDGLLDLVIGDALGRLSILRLLPKTFNGSHIREPVVQTVRCTWIEMTSDDPLPVLADGEIIYTNAHELSIRVLPKALRVIVGPEEGKRPG